MRRNDGDFGEKQLACFSLIFMGFLLTSCGYISWMYHLMSFFSSVIADSLTMGCGYVLQAVGIGIFVILFGRAKDSFSSRSLISAVALYSVCLIPAMLGTSSVGVAAFGLLSQVLCGIIAGFYLYALTVLVPVRRRGFIFGAAYSAATVAAWLLSLPGKGSFLQAKPILFLYLIMAALTVIAGFKAFRMDSKNGHADPAVSSETASGSQAGTSRSGGNGKTDPGNVRNLILLACAAVFLMSLVKNIGFSYPSGDLTNGLSLEMTRLLYAAGLLCAGFANDKDRRYGAIFTVAALVTPFIILSLAGENVLNTILWCLNYFIFGFFSVYRIVLFSDIAEKSSLLWISGFGLLAGRVGDAAGYAVTLLFSKHSAVLVMTAALLFVITIFVIFRLYQFLYVPAVQQNRSEKEMFEHFAHRHDLSAREREVLKLLLQEKTNAEIAEKLYVSESTVKFHIHNLLKKTGCKNRNELKSAYSLHA